MVVANCCCASAQVWQVVTHSGHVCNCRIKLDQVPRAWLMLAGCLHVWVRFGRSFANIDLCSSLVEMGNTTAYTGHNPTMFAEARLPEQSLCTASVSLGVCRWKLYRPKIDPRRIADRPQIIANLPPCRHPDAPNRLKSCDLDRLPWSHGLAAIPWVAAIALQRSHGLR